MTSIGSKPNQIPVNGMLGTLAFQDAAAVNIEAGIIGTKSVAELNNATANDTDARLRDRATHTGTQPMATIDGLQPALDAKQNASAVIAKTATAQTSLLSDAGQYLRFTNAAASTYTIAPQASVAWPDNAEITIRRAADGNLTLAPGSGVTLNPPSGGTLVLTDNMTVTLKRVATNVWDVIGQTVPA